jgi:CheY-like chemotaxis protein
VDDEVAILEALTDILSVEGYEVATATNGAEGLKRASEERPELILLDLMMPVMDGQEFCAEQQSDPTLRDIPVVVFTAFGAALEQMKEVEAMPHLDKPVQADELLDSVELWSEEEPELRH